MPSTEELFFAEQVFPRGGRVLDVGCGPKKKVSWATGMDFVKSVAADVVHDLNDVPWPFPDDSFDVVVASHVLEHVPDMIRVCREIHRVSKPGALIRVATPHYSNPATFTDPTHVRGLSYQTFEYFCRPEDCPLPSLQRRLQVLLGGDPAVAGWYTDPLFEIVDRRITFRKIHRWIGLDAFARRFPLFYEFYLAGIAPARDMQVLLRVKKSSSS
jgi:SAM-dependent methyltransferase